MSFVFSVNGVGQWIPCRADRRWETYGHGVSGPQALARRHLCKFLFAELPSVSDSISGICLATRSSPSAEVTSGEQLLISVCMHTVCENMQDSKWLVYYWEVILPTGTELLEKRPPYGSCLPSSAITHRNIWDKNGVNFKETHFSISLLTSE